MVLDILQIGDKRLNEKSVTIKKSEIKSKEIQKLIDDMQDTLNVDPDSSAGLSAVQVGVLKTVFIFRRIDLEEEGDAPIWEVAINPELKILSKKLNVDWEGCLSIGVGDNRIFGPVARASKVEMTYLDREGEKHTLKADDYLAHILQHEDDHLNGLLFIKYVHNPRNLWKGGELEEYIEKTGEYPAIY